MAAMRLLTWTEQWDQAGISGNAGDQKRLHTKIALDAAMLAKKREGLYSAGLTNLASLNAEQRAVWEVARSIIDEGKMTSRPEAMLLQNPRTILGAVEKERDALAKIVEGASDQSGVRMPGAKPAVLEHAVIGEQMRAPSPTRPVAPKSETASSGKRENERPNFVRAIWFGGCLVVVLAVCAMWLRARQSTGGRK